MTDQNSAGVIVSFMSRYFLDKQKGAVQPLASYQKSFPGYETIIAREYEKLQADPAPLDLHAAESPHIDGDRIGPYTLLEELGRGGQGLVYLAEDTRLHRKVALKVLTAVAAASIDMRARLLREAEATSRLDHPGICTVYEVGETGGQLYIAMRHIEGDTLARKIDRDRSTRKPHTRDAILENVRLIEHTARALHFAHEAGLIHRDIKPGNLMIGEAGNPVILDFGLARADEGDALTLTRTGQLLGTPSYMAPEQIDAGHGCVDRRADIYSLGVTLYESLTLHLPYEAPTREQLFQAILTREPPDPRTHNPVISRDLLAIFQTTLEKDPDRRYRTAEALANDLEALRENRPVSVKPISTVGRVFRWSRRKPAMACLITLLLVGIPVLAGLGGFLAANWKTLERGEQEEKRRVLESLLQEGYLELCEGDATLAISAFETALEKSTDPLPEAVAGLALTYLSINNPGAALNLLDHHRPAGHKGLEWIRVEALGAQGREEAEVLEKSLEQPHDALGFFLLGTRELNRGHLGDRKAYRNALSFYTRAIYYAEQARALYFFEAAHAAGHCRDTGIAASTVDILTSRWRTSATAWYWAAYALKDTDPDRAIALYRKALQLEPDFANACSNLAVLLKEKGQCDEALSVARKAVELRPDMAASHTNLGAVLFHCGLLEEAAAAHEKALQLDPDYARAHTNLGAVLLEQGSLEKAAAELKEAIRLDPDSALAHTFLGVVFWHRNQLDRAILAHRKAILLDPGLPHPHTNLGIVLASKGQLEEAAAAYRKAIRLAPNNGQIHLNLGCALRSDGRPDEAVTAFKEAVRLMPDNSQALENLGCALEENDRLDEAVAALKKAISINTDSANAHFRMGWALWRKGLLEEAAQAFEETIEIQPDHATAHYNLGMFHLQERSLDEAAASFRRTIRAKPDHAEAHCNLGQVLKEKGCYHEALVMLRKGDRIGSRMPGWQYDSARWVQDCERLVLREGRRAALAGFESDPEKMQDETARARLRKKALTWLKEVFRGWREHLESGGDAVHIRKILRKVKQDEALMALEDPGHLGRLPAAEQQGWKDLWKELGDLGARTTSSK